jgi:triosephosphate isomerase (TIM)
VDRVVVQFSAVSRPPGIYNAGANYRKMQHHLQRGVAAKGYLRMAKVRPLVAGNWKMNGARSSLGEVVLIRDAVAAGRAGRAEVLICPPATLLMAAAGICEGFPLKLGGQDCHAEDAGAFTGDISAAMLKDAGASYVILGHSERRAGYRESDESVRRKAKAALRAGLCAIVCVGETIAEREAGEAMAAVHNQLAGSIPENAPPERIVVAYEPVWAIGSGLTPGKKEISEMHGFIRQRLSACLLGQGTGLRILYGGSVKPENATDVLSAENVDGALVGGASLSSVAFMEIAGFYR